MTKTQSDDERNGQARRAAAIPLNAGIRRHLGLNLRSLYANSLVEPMGERIESLLTKLGRDKG